MVLLATTEVRMNAIINGSETYGQTVIDVDSYSGRTMHINTVDMSKSMFDAGTPFIFFDDGELMVAAETLLAVPHLPAEIRSLTNKNVTKITKGDSSTIQNVYRETLQNSSSTNVSSGDVSDALESLTNIAIEALRLKASDIHVYLRSPLSEICYRVDGELTEFNSHKPMAYERAKKMLAVAYNWSGSNSNTSGEFDLRSLQPTSFDLEVADPATGERKRVTLRLEKGPEYLLGNAKCTIRVSESSKIRDLDELGVEPHIVSIIKKYMVRPNGMILVSGPTGSGKTTFLHGALHYIPKGKTIYTIEDPVELVASYNPRISQQNLIPGETFNTQLRSYLRQDPNVIMLGELRDVETVAVSYRAALTGHLILSTIHTPNSLGIITRLHDFGMSYADLAYEGALSLLIACRLIRTLCPKCKIPLQQDYMYTAKITKMLGSINGVYQASPTGCPDCSLGRKGRTSVIEYTVVTAKLRSYIISGDISSARKYLESHGWQSLQNIGWELIKNGVIDPLDAEMELTDILLDSSEDFAYSSHRNSSANIIKNNTISTSQLSSGAL